MTSVVGQEEKGILCLQLTAPGLISGTLVSAEVIGDHFKTKLSIASDEPRNLAVNPGEYLVRAFMPSGEMVGQETCVTKGKTSLVELKPNQSYYGWHYFLDNAYLNDSSLGIAQFPATWQRLWSHRKATWGVQAWPTEWKAPIGKRVVSYGLRIPPKQLHFLQIGGDEVPWRLIALPPSTDLKVLVYPSEGRVDFKDDLSVAVVSHDRKAESLLSYLVSGRIEAAKIIADELLSEQARTLLLENPVGAVIGGYYLLRVGVDKHYHDWLSDFVNEVDWLPDAAVIHAWHLLRASDKPNRDQIRQHLLQAVERGVPIYTQGFRLLFDGLQLLTQDASARQKSDSELERAFKSIQKYAVAADWSQPLTTFYGDSPQSPSFKKLITRTPERQEGIVWLTPEKKSSLAVDKQRTYYPTQTDLAPKKWHVIDAQGLRLGRLASEITTILQGKNKPTYTPHLDTGDYVIVINAEKVEVTGKKRIQKVYYRHSGRPGGMKTENFKQLQARIPERIIEQAVKGMLPKNSLGRKLFTKLKVYSGPDHPHQAQKPDVLTLNRSTGQSLI